MFLFSYYGLFTIPCSLVNGLPLAKQHASSTFRSTYRPHRATPPKTNTWNSLPLYTTNLINTSKFTFKSTKFCRIYYDNPVGISDPKTWQSKLSKNFPALSGKQNKTKQNKTKQNKTKQNKTKQNITACKSCTFRGDNIRWNFLHHTAASRCEDFRTFRSLTPSPSTGCAAGLVEPQAHPVDGESPKRWLKYDIVSTSARYCCVSSNACHVHLLIFYVYKTIATQNWLNLLHKLLSHSVQAVSFFNKVKK